MNRENDPGLQERLSHWKDYLSWRRQIAYEYYNGIKCAGAVYDVRTKQWSVLIAALSQEKLNLFLQAISKTVEYEIAPNYASEDRWACLPDKDYNEWNPCIGNFSSVVYRKRFDSMSQNDLSAFKALENLETFMADLKLEYPEAIIAQMRFQSSHRNKQDVISEGFLVTPQIAEIALLNRQKKAIQDLETGQSASLHISNWLFDIQKARIPDARREQAFTCAWKNGKLNSDQQLAVRKALLCPDVCLVQGPPGTGKTTVISEIVYQTVCKGQRVLIASQTHAAVDNAIERLITDPSVRAVRLGKPTKINPAVHSFLEENAFFTFCESISNNLKAKFPPSNEENQSVIVKVDGDLLKIQELNHEISAVESEIEEISYQISQATEAKAGLTRQYDAQYAERLAIQNRIFALEVLHTCLESGTNFDTWSFCCEELMLFCNVLKNTGFCHLQKYRALSTLHPQSHAVQLYQSNLEWSDILHKLIDSTTEDVRPLKEAVLSAANDVLNELREYSFSSCIEDAETAIQAQISEYEDTYNTLLEKQEENLRRRIAFSEQYHIPQGQLITALQKRKKELEALRFGTDNVLKQDWQEIANEMIAMLENSDWISNGNEVFQTDYINACNVVGVSCTENSKTLLSKGFRDFDLVVIDEISKATPPEMLIPLIKARRAVLVGDHRQLPPVFTFGAKMSQEEREVDPERAKRLDNLFSPQNKDRFQNMVTASIFEQWFKRANPQIRQRLNFQYRMHHDISSLVNRFYNFQLKDGWPVDEEETAKKHGLTVCGIGGEAVIRLDCHAYWFDSSRNRQGDPCYSSRRSGSTSQENIYEADAVLALLEKVNQIYLQSPDDTSSISVGVISFYKDQIQRIGNAVRKRKFKAIDVEVSTVDAFQGKEKNIIFVSMVSNTPEKRATDFIRQFERMNVAFSRARNLLVIFGAAELFREQSVYLPNMDTDGGTEKQIYKNMIQQLQGADAFWPCWELLGE